MSGLVKKWIKQAEYDLKTAQAMLQSKRYLYVAFMCQQSLEKLLKAFILEQTQKTPPHIHRLMPLVELLHLKVDTEKIDFLNFLTRYYINCRYPEEKQNLSRLLNHKKCTDIYQKTVEMMKWLKRSLRTQRKSSQNTEKN